MKYLKEWLLGLLGTIILGLGSIGYNNLQTTLNEIKTEQISVAKELKETYSNQNVNKEEITTIKKDIKDLNELVAKNQDYTNAKFDMYESNLREFYQSYKHKPLSQIRELYPENHMWIDEKYYDTLNYLYYANN